MRPKCDHSWFAVTPPVLPTLPHTPKNINSVEQLSTCKNLLVTNQHVHTMERNYCWGTILPRGFQGWGIINSLKKSMCKILLIKTKQNPYQCSADLPTKSLPGQDDAMEGSEQPPAGAGSCGHGVLPGAGAGRGWHLQGLEGQLWSCDSLEVLGLELWEEWAALSGAGARPGHPCCSGDGTMPAAPAQSAQCGHRAASPWHSPTETRGCDQCGCPAATSPSAPCPEPSLAFLSSPGIVQQERKELRSLA